MFNFNRKDDMFEEYYASKAESSTATEEVPKRFSPEECQEERSEGEFDEYYSDKEPAKEKEIPMVPRRLHTATVCFYSIIMILLVIGNFFNSRHIKRVEEDLRLATEEAEFSRATIKAYELRAERDEELIDSLQRELAVKELDSFLRNYDFSESDSAISDDLPDESQAEPDVTAPTARRLNPSSDPKPNPDPDPKPDPDPSPEPPSPEPPSPGPDSPKSQSYDGIDIVPNDDSGPGAYVDDFMKTQPSSDG
ncbi:hypothetical protein IJI79_00265 [Candidatus Saccharibacteria bacterium]|nr:hypothetical protein [Candidatus Saccharibacteria bacterium]